METDDDLDHATMRESFSLVQSILFTYYTDLLLTQRYYFWNIPRSIWKETQNFGIFSKNFENYREFWKFSNYNFQSRRQILTPGGVYVDETWGLDLFLSLLVRKRSPYSSTTRSMFVSLPIGWPVHPTLD